MDFNLILYICGCIVLIGFFAGLEIAFASANRINIELKKKQGGFSGRVLGRFMENPSDFIGANLVGSTIILVIYGVLVARFNEGWFRFLPVVFSVPYIKIIIDIVIAAAVILAFGEIMPRTLFRSKPETVLSFFAIPMWLMHHFFSPIARLFVGISEFILKYLFNVRIKDKQVFNRVDMAHFIRHTLQGHDAEPTEVNTELFENALELISLKLRKCMVPRNEIVGVSADATIGEVKQKFMATKLSRIVVYEGNLDTIVGYLHHLDLNKNPKDLRDVMHTIAAVPEAMSAVDLLTKFNKERKNIAWVIDEFGGTAGIVTMEDVLEEIFGDIKDEYDIDEYVEKQIAEHEFIFSGRLELDYLNEKYGFDLQAEGAETLSGFIISHYETIPKNKARIIIGLYEFDILLVTDTRIETVKMKVLKPL
ncbi:MAG TPA: hemolysin family protein [Flavipsychrobacter sp.]|nr:hemolysin family protein [Flavipsychrobacter sp.]